MLSSQSSTNSQTWWCMISICFVRFWLVGSLVKVRLVLLSPSIFIPLTASFNRSSLTNVWIQMSFLALWLMATYSASEVDMETILCYLLYQVVIASPIKNQYPVVEFRFFGYPAKLLLAYPTISQGRYWSK